ncbi:hypothetical protein PR048_018288 [Dryococelus australis]|uniref:THAP9-like helix-turn-helix domain-containing protein n=1 Tax=Dryococelus australis TaxID=614101 RepID=A0ABQ9HBV1_9NEOP|nr:hypothetical protein PR048_018288 [Dryococelus australis]
MKTLPPLHHSVKKRKLNDFLHSNAINDEQHAESVTEEEIESVDSLSAKLKAMEQEIMLLNMKVSDLENEIKRRRESENRFENENKIFKQQLLQIKICISDNFLMLKQIDRFLTKNKCCWGKEDIVAAVTLRSVSRKAHVYMRNKVGLPLPSLSTLRKWTRNLWCKPGIHTEVLTVLEATSKIMKEIKR